MGDCDEARNDRDRHIVEIEQLHDRVDELDRELGIALLDRSQLRGELAKAKTKVDRFRDEITDKRLALDRITRAARLVPEQIAMWLEKNGSPNAAASVRQEVWKP